MIINNKFDMYFFYESRRKLRNSMLLDMFPLNIKQWLLTNYTVKNYKRIDIWICIFKTVVISLVYAFFIFTLNLPNEFLTGLPITIYLFISFISILIILSFNKKTVDNIEKDHYYRLLGELQVDFLKKVHLKRINYGFTSWIIPLTLFPFVYSTLISNPLVIIGYIVFSVIIYELIVIISFLSQKVYFYYLKNYVVLDNILDMVITSSIIVLSLLITALTLYLLKINTNNILVLSIIIIALITLIIFVDLIKQKAIKSSMNYSVTNILITNKKDRYINNNISNPSTILKLIHTKNKDVNYIISKDFISLYRKDKSRMIGFIFLGISSFAYSMLLISGIKNDGYNFNTLFFIDNIFSVGILTFFIGVFYKLKNDTWYSCESSNLLLFSKLGVDRHNIYKAKKRVNYILLSPTIIMYMIVPFIFLVGKNFELNLYLVFRIIYLYLLYSIVIDYSLYKDTIEPRITRYHPVSGIGGIGIGVLAVIVQGIFPIWLINLFREKSVFIFDVEIGISKLILLVFFISLVIIKSLLMIISFKLKNTYEKVKLYG